MIGRRGISARHKAGAGEAWGRRRLLAMVAGAAVVVVALVVGLALSVWYALGGSMRTPTANGAASAAVGDDLPVRERIAAAPMAVVDRQAAYTPEPAAVNSPTMRVPLPADDDPGLAGVAVGFPHSPAGAVGQWAAIERRVLEAMDLQVADEVRRAWVLPGGPSLAEWELTRSVQAFLASAKQAGQRKDTSTLVAASPAGALVKGSDGPDWVLACVLLDVRAVVNVEARTGYGLCARMVWVEDRWMVGPGSQPATAPSTWPGSASATRAGWLTWVDAEAQR